MSACVVFVFVCLYVLMLVARASSPSLFCCARSDLVVGLCCAWRKLPCLRSAPLETLPCPALRCSTLLHSMLYSALRLSTLLYSTPALTRIP